MTRSGLSDAAAEPTADEISRLDATGPAALIRARKLSPEEALNAAIARSSC